MYRKAIATEDASHMNCITLNYSKSYRKVTDSSQQLAISKHEFCCKLTQYSTRIQQNSLLTSPTYNMKIFLSSKINENKYK